MLTQKQLEIADPLILRLLEAGYVQDHHRWNGNLRAAIAEAIMGSPDWRGIAEKLAEASGDLVDEITDLGKQEGGGDPDWYCGCTADAPDSPGRICGLHRAREALDTYQKAKTGETS